LEKINKTHKLKRILDHIQKNKISAYSIAKGTKISEAGIGKIINKSSKNPQNSTVDRIYEYLFGLSEKSIKQSYIEVMEAKVPIDIWALKTVENLEELKKHAVFSNIIKLEVSQELLKLSQDKNALKEFLGLKDQGSS
jgi:predicted transcriptional regulator